MSEKPLLFVTTFNKEFYEASGLRLIRTFLSTQSSIYADLLCCTEGLNNFTNFSPEIKQQLLGSSDFLGETLNKNLDIIPSYLGGTSQVCNCHKPWGKRDDSHIKGCYFTWWNRNWSRWFRKVVSTYYASAHTYQYLVWVDSDCEFLLQIKPEIIYELLARRDVFYMRGKRRAVESGIFGIKLTEAGINFINEWLRLYTSGDFRQYERWDDGYIFTRLIKKGIAKSMDITYKQYPGDDVARHTPLSRYIRHNKGLHGRGLGIMK